MNIHNEYDLEKLLFRRQFILGPRFVEQMSSWKRIMVGGRFSLTVHPELNVEQACQGEKSVTLLGYTLDPSRPEATNTDIVHTLLHQLLSTCRSLDDFLKRTYAYGGRWVLIVDDGHEVRLFSDPMGYRQVFYTNRHYQEDVWLASQPGIIAETLQFDPDREAVSQFVNTEFYRSWTECVFPGNDCLYKEISHLLPNHYLDLNSGSCRRYWPDGNLGRLSLEEAVEVNSSLLVQLMRSACNRHDLALAVTAGWDSRVLLAASRDLKDDFYYFTLSIEGYERDTLIPSRLLPKLGVKHHVIHFPDVMEKEFEKIYVRNTSAAHSLWGRMGQALLEHYPAGRLCVKGNASEIARVRFRLPEGEELTARHLALFSGFGFGPQMAENPYVIRSWDNWLSKLKESYTYNAHVLDLFYWEHWAGNFAAMAQAEWDMVQEVLVPYNCRDLLTNMLSVDEKYRDHDDPILYREMAARLWPEVLEEPVNPPAAPPTGLRAALRKVLIKTNLYQFLPKKVRRLGSGV